MCAWSLAGPHKRYVPLRSAAEEVERKKRQQEKYNALCDGLITQADYDEFRKDEAAEVEAVRRPPRLSRIITPRVRLRVLACRQAGVPGSLVVFVLFCFFQMNERNEIMMHLTMRGIVMHPNRAHASFACSTISIATARLPR